MIFQGNITASVLYMLCFRKVKHSNTCKSIGISNTTNHAYLQRRQTVWLTPRGIGVDAVGKMVELLMRRVQGASADRRPHHGLHRHRRRRNDRRRRRMVVVRLPHWIRNQERLPRSDSCTQKEKKGKTFKPRVFPKASINSADFCVVNTAIKKIRFWAIAADWRQTSTEESKDFGDSHKTGRHFAASSVSTKSARLACRKGLAERWRFRLDIHHMQRGQSWGIKDSTFADSSLPNRNWQERDTKKWLPDSGFTRKIWACVFKEQILKKCSENDCEDSKSKSSHQHGKIRAD